MADTTSYIDLILVFHNINTKLLIVEFSFSPSIQYPSLALLEPQTPNFMPWIYTNYNFPFLSFHFTDIDLVSVFISINTKSKGRQILKTNKKG